MWEVLLPPLTITLVPKLPVWGPSRAVRRSPLPPLLHGRDMDMDTPVASPSIITPRRGKRVHSGDTAVRNPRLWEDRLGRENRRIILQARTSGGEGVRMKVPVVVVVMVVVWRMWGIFTQRHHHPFPRRMESG